MHALRERLPGSCPNPVWEPLSIRRCPTEPLTPRDHKLFLKRLRLCNYGATTTHPWMGGLNRFKWVTWGMIESSVEAGFCGGVPRDVEQATPQFDTEILEKRTIYG